MQLDPQVRAFLDMLPGAESPDESTAGRRAALHRAADAIFARVGEPAAPVHSVTDFSVSSIRVRVYRPDASAALPIHIFIHGGGFWLGSIDELAVDATCRERCLGANCVVVDVDYRLAPEHRYPTPVEDCYGVLVWAHEHAADLGGDPRRITIGGVSAGANLAAAVALAARDRTGPALLLQLLEVPVLDLTLETMRASGVPDCYGITVGAMAAAVTLYLPNPEQATDPLASPLRCPDLGGLPPARVMTAEFDPLRLDGRAYAERLCAAGVAAEHHEYPGAVHGSSVLTGTWEPARQWRADAIRALTLAHDEIRAEPGSGGSGGSGGSDGEFGRLAR